MNALSTVLIGAAAGVLAVKLYRKQSEPAAIVPLAQQPEKPVAAPVPAAPQPQHAAHATNKTPAKRGRKPKTAHSNAAHVAAHEPEQQESAS